ncbi:F-box/FBD/LRR-repeat protein At1g13570-like [Rosa rugosa]|uniref:F-box/FBD/LRR-repeat protein At1g13570-like n=1 Tax=Rosa rugosa TaxID=74645 RepID=UPI002B41425F|nr:F-box/FBD/LRR-repeat protein At1g13570-like [Rosa rugosa]
MLPHLVFDDKCIPTEHYTFVNIVDHVLSSHIGSIHKFELAQENLSFRDIDRWILHVSRNSVKELILEKACGDYELYLMPSYMYVCMSRLDALKLNKCLLQPPSTFKGFKSLRILCIGNVNLDQEMLENFTSCFLLERLTLKDCHGFQQLKIDAPNLRFLLFTGDFEDINILNTLNLVDATIGLRFRRSGPCRPTNLLKFFANLPHIQRLRISSYFTKYLAIGSSLEKLPS